MTDLGLASSESNTYNHPQQRNPWPGGTMTQYHDRLVAGDYSAPPSADELEEATVADLKDQLAARGLPTTGNKADLIERLATPPADSE
jgi:hypothetical protein